MYAEFDNLMTAAEWVHYSPNASPSQKHLAGKT